MLTWFFFSSLLQCIQTVEYKIKWKIRVELWSISKYDTGVCFASIHNVIVQYHTELLPRLCVHAKRSHIQRITQVAASQSHLPSFQPVLHRSSQNRQSNSFFPSFRFTSLCASHIHVPKSDRPPNRGSFFPLGSAIHVRKSSAHTQHGYSREKSFRNVRISVCCSIVAFFGYVAVMEWRSVQVDRPSCSTSGGHSAWVGAGREEGNLDSEVVGGFATESLEVEVEAAAVGALACLVRARQDAAEVQSRQLGEYGLVFICLFLIEARGLGGTYGFPSLSRTTPLADLVFESSSFVESVDELAVAAD